MGWLWGLTIGALALALASWVVARRAARRAAQLSDMYLAAALRPRRAEDAGRRAGPGAGRTPRTAPGTHFVALTDVKR